VRCGRPLALSACRAGARSFASTCAPGDAPQTKLARERLAGGASAASQCRAWSAPYRRSSSSGVHCFAAGQSRSASVTTSGRPAPCRHSATSSAQGLSSAQAQRESARKQRKHAWRHVRHAADAHCAGQPLQRRRCVRLQERAQRVVLLCRAAAARKQRPPGSALRPRVNTSRKAKTQPVYSPGAERSRCQVAGECRLGPACWRPSAAGTG